jgi:hypothetical protein
MVWQTEERPADKTAWPETLTLKDSFMSTPTRDDFAALLDETLAAPPPVALKAASSRAPSPPSKTTRPSSTLA